MKLGRKGNGNEVKIIDKMVDEEGKILYKIGTEGSDSKWKGLRELTQHIGQIQEYEKSEGRLPHFRKEPIVRQESRNQLPSRDTKTAALFKKRERKQVYKRVGRVKFKQIKHKPQYSLSDDEQPEPLTITAMREVEGEWVATVQSPSQIRTVRKSLLRLTHPSLLLNYYETLCQEQ